MASQLVYTPLDEINRIHASLKAGFASGKTKNLAYRKHQLVQLGYMLQDHSERFLDALKSDIGKPTLEADFMELNHILVACGATVNKIDKWAAPERPPFSLQDSFVRPLIRKEPKGVVLIISPFNFPLGLALAPLVGAIAAGNAALIKPAELTPQTSALLAELIPKYLDSELYAVVNGGIPETTRVLELQWDHILYTGSGRVAKVVAKAAAEHLTPITLELGGKSPVFIDEKCDLQMAARRILWGKYLAAGQVCVAPDYAMVPRGFQDAFVQELVKVTNEFYPQGAKDSESFCRIINPQHAARIKKLVDATQGNIVIGGEADVEKRYISPTIVKDVKADDSLMSEEIFGPVLPILPVDNLEEAIGIVNSMDHPLALYVFSKDNQFKQKVFDNTQSGAAVANEIMMHLGVDGLPFGGVGPSGYGQYLGKFSFDTFTHLRSSIDSPGWLDKLLWARFPPYTPEKRMAAKKLMPAKLPKRDQYKQAASAPHTGSASGSSMVSWVLFGVVASTVGVFSRLL